MDKKFCDGLKNNMYRIVGDSGNPNLPMTQFMITKNTMKYLDMLLIHN